LEGGVSKKDPNQCFITGEKNVSYGVGEQAQTDAGGPKNKKKIEGHGTTRYSLRMKNQRVKKKTSETAREGGKKSLRSGSVGSTGLNGGKKKPHIHHLNKDKGEKGK